MLVAALAHDPQVLDLPLPDLADHLSDDRHRAPDGAVELDAEVLAVLEEAGDRFLLGHALVDERLRLVRAVVRA